MAYTFNGSNQHLSTSTSPVSNVPITMACWFRSTTASTNQALIQINDATATNRFLMAANYALSPSLLRVFTAQDGGGNNANASDYVATLSANTTYHAAGVYASSTSRTAYLNGLAATTNTNSVVNGAVDRMQIGTRLTAGSNGLFFNGWIAEVGIWSAALTAAEIASLAAGVSCRLIRPQSLAFYAPLIRDLVDMRGGLTITNNNTATVSVHPRVYA